MDGSSPSGTQSSSKRALSQSPTSEVYPGAQEDPEGALQADPQAEVLARPQTRRRQDSQGGLREGAEGGVRTHFEEGPEGDCTGLWQLPRVNSRRLIIVIIMKWQLYEPKSLLYKIYIH